MIPEEIADAIERTVSRAVREMEDFISTMERAANEIALGRDLKQIEVGGHQVYLASGEESREEAVILAMDFDDYFQLLADSASVEGLDLEESAELEVRMPEAEFGENMITGGFGDFKGFSLELRNELLEELLGAVQSSLQERGLVVACLPDEDVLFCLPLRRSDRQLNLRRES